jgi:hypothetical protein
MKVQKYIPLTVLSFTRVTLDHLVASFETGKGHIRDSVLFMMSFLRRDDRSKCRKREVNPRETVSSQPTRLV